MRWVTHMLHCIGLTLHIPKWGVCVWTSSSRPLLWRSMSGLGLFFFICSFYPPLFVWLTLGMFPADKAAGGYFPFLSASGIAVPYEP